MWLRPSFEFIILTTAVLLFLLAELAILLTLSAGFMDLGSFFANAFRIITLSGLIIVYFVDKRFKSRSRWFFICIFIASLIAPLLIQPVQNYQNNRNRESAKNILSGLNHYKNKVGHFPFSLNQLQPDYLKQLPEFWLALNKGKFNYKRIGQDQFILQYPGFNGFTLGYSSNQQE